MNIGIAGTGRMGSAIATRLLGLGHSLTVWNRTRDKLRLLAAAGAALADTPAQLAQRAEAIITILTDAAAIEGVYEGADGLLQAGLEGKLVIEMSTVRPETERALAAKVKSCGGAFVECPVGGTVGPARDGKLFGFVGGEEADVARARPLLEAMCRRVEHVGAAGAGAQMKLAINLPLLVFWQAFGEALSLAEPLGIDATRLMDIFADTSGAPNILKVRGPTVAEALRGKTIAPVTFDVDSIRKDLRTMVAEANARGARLPVTAQALACFDEASRAGLGAEDGTMLPAYWVRHGKV